MLSFLYPHCKMHLLVLLRYFLIFIEHTFTDKRTYQDDFSKHLPLTRYIFIIWRKEHVFILLDKTKLF